MSDVCCVFCSGKGAIGWVTMRNVNDAVECPICRGTGGWEKQPRTRLTLNDLRQHSRAINEEK